MITTLNATTTSQVVAQLLEQEGSSGSSRVLTLVISTGPGGLEEALCAAHGASLDHPCRIIAVVTPADSPASARASREGAEGAEGTDGQPGGGQETGGLSTDGQGTDGQGTDGQGTDRQGTDRHGPASGHLDAEIRVGHDAGAGETIVLRPWGEAAEHTDTLVVPFLLPDTPVVVWWPWTVPASPAEDPLGQLATTRITNTPAQEDPQSALAALAPVSARGDIDLAWTRITLWRAMVASVLDSAVREGSITRIEVVGEPRNSSACLMQTWLHLRLGVPVTRRDAPGFTGIASITAWTAAGQIVISRHDHERVTVTRPGSTSPQVVTMERREPVTTLNEELRRLTPDLLYQDVLTSFGADPATRTGPLPSPAARPDTTD